MEEPRNVEEVTAPPGMLQRFAFWQWALLGIVFMAGVALLIIPAHPVMLSWETASEVGTAGFNVYRSPAGQEDYQQVNATLIPAQGDELVGAEYNFPDEDVTPVQRYDYRIEEVEWSGGTTMYPDTVTVRAGLPGFWIRVEGVLLLGLAAFLLWRGLRWNGVTPPDDPPSSV